MPCFPDTSGLAPNMLAAMTYYQTWSEWNCIWNSWRIDLICA